MHASDYYEVGQSVYFWAQLRDRFKQAVDPLDLELHIKPPPPAATIVVPLAELVHEALGRFSYTYTVDAQGMWSYAFHSDNPDDVDGDRFHVSNSSHP